MLASIGLLGAVAVFAAANGWTLMQNVYYNKTWVYDQTTLDEPNSFYSLVGWHTNNTAADRGTGENNYGVGTTAGNNGAVGGSVYVTSAKNLTTVNGGTVDLYVSWEKNHYRIIYSPNNVTNNRYGDPYTTTATGTVADTECRYDTDVTLRNNGFTRPGYKFVEWNTQSNGQGDTYHPGQHLTKPNFVSNNNGTFTLYAIWEPITYTVNLYSNKPTDATNPITKGSTYGTSVHVASYTDYYGTSHDLNWSEWNDGKVTKKFRFDSMDLLPQVSDNVKADKSANPSAAVKAGVPTVYNLTGWRADNTVWYTVKGNNGTASGTTYTSGTRSLTPTDDATLDLYAYWYKHKFTLKYDPNYDPEENIEGNPDTSPTTGSTPDTPAEYDTPFTLPEPGFDKPGYEFNGWSPDPDAIPGEDELWQPGETVEPPESNLTEDDNGVVPIYPIWTPKVYTIRLDPSGGTFDEWDDTYGRYFYEITFDSCVVRDLPPTSIHNHSFIGWARYEQSIEESVNNSSFVNKMYYEGNKRIYISRDETKQANDIFFDPIAEAKDELIIYAWYNQLPIFADVYDGQFFEGQRVSYQDLLDLVAVFDYEDDYYNTVVQYIYDLPEINEEDIYIPINKSEGGNDSEQNVVNPDVDASGPEYVLDTSKWSDNGNGTYTELATGRVYYTIEKKMELEDQINASSLVIKISDISYEVVNGVKQPEGSWESKMGVVNDADWTNDDILENYYWLDTSTRRIDKSSFDTEPFNTAYENAKGHFNITFTVTDNGIMCGGELVTDSPITLNYTRLCTIQYNALPQIYIRNVTWYEDTTDLEDITTILSNQLVLDSEDCVNNPPWWYTKSSDNTTGMYPKTYHGNGDKTLGVLYKTGSTYEDLQMTLKEEFVWGVVVMPYLDRDKTADVEEAISNWVNSGIKTADITALKDNPDTFVGDCTKAEVYDAILSFNVCIDARDQWGKWASGKIDAQNHRNPDDPNPPDPTEPPDPDDPSGGGPDPQPPGPDPIPDTPDPDPDDPDDPDKGQPYEKRSVTVYKINIEVDTDMEQANIAEKVRFISDKYIGTVEADSYWGDAAYGFEILQGILDARDAAVDKTPSQYTGSFEGKNGNTVDITVNDYTD